MVVASLWGDANYGAAFELLNNLRQRTRWIVNKWPNVKDGDCSFGGTVHIIRMILDVYADGTVFHAEEVIEWTKLFEKLHKRANKRLPEHIGLDAYSAQVLEDLAVILDNANHSVPREAWEKRRDRDVQEYTEWLEWRKAFVQRYKPST